MYFLCLIVTICGCDRNSPQTVQTPETHKATAHLHDHKHGHGQQTHAHDGITEADMELPADYAAVVKRLREYDSRIKSAIEQGKPDEARRPLDEAEIVLEHIGKIARDSNLPRSDWEMISTARRALRESFEALQDQIEAREVPDYKAVEHTIDRALNEIEAASDDTPL
jgi:chaperonin cofactor prefoldin